MKLSVPNCATKHKDECKHKIATHDLWNKSHYKDFGWNAIIGIGFVAIKLDFGTDWQKITLKTANHKIAICSVCQQTITM